MICPKCAATQEDGREECGSCGVIFARWRQSQERPLPRTVATTGETPTPGSGFPLWVVIVVVPILVLGGLLWTSHRREQRAKRDPARAIAQQVNEINNAGADARRKLQEARKVRASPRIDLSAPVPPKDAAARRIIDLIEACPDFRNGGTASFPKTFREADYAWVVQQFPALFVAARDQLVEFQPPIPVYPRGSKILNPTVPSQTISVILTGKGIALYIRDIGDLYEADLGQRRIRSIDRMSNDANGSSHFTFSWMFEEGFGARLKGDPGGFRGGGEMIGTGAEAQLKEAWLAAGDRRVSICR